ncbi:MAG: hypothetical protein HGB12_09010 [Bacteroidetes bacterium]|nr:hypothetical protein [Bacteroidota bacterium]
MLSRFFLFFLFVIGVNISQSKSESYFDFLLKKIPTPLISTFDSSKIIINKIILKGNKITKLQIISREILFKENDTLDYKNLTLLISQSRKNLINTSLFNFVTINADSVSQNKFDITIDFIERWYIWPLPFFEFSDRNFNVWWKTKNFSKIDYGLYLVWDNFRGRKESLKLQIRFGYNETYSLAYNIPYIDKEKKIGMGITAGIKHNHEIPYLTDYNKQLVYKNEKNYVQQNTFGTYNITYRKGIFNLHTFQLNYNDFIFSDSLLKLNSNFAEQTHNKFLSFYYQLKCDHRDNRAYPLLGYYYDIELTKYGLGVFENKKIDFAFMHTSIRKFWKLNNRFYLGGGINAKISTPAFQPYYLEKGLGFGNDFVRAYEYYVVDGQNFILLKSNLKFELIPTKIKKIKFVPSKKFNIIHYALYLNVFADAAYVNDNQIVGNNILSNSYLFGSGLSLDFVTYYDKVMRLEYSCNKKWQSGIFVHFIAPI